MSKKGKKSKYRAQILGGCNEITIRAKDSPKGLGADDDMPGRLPSPEEWEGPGTYLVFTVPEWNME